MVVVVIVIVVVMERRGCRGVGGITITASIQLRRGQCNGERVVGPGPGRRHRRRPGDVVSWVSGRSAAGQVAIAAVAVAVAVVIAAVVGGVALAQCTCPAHELESIPAIAICSSLAHPRHKAQSMQAKALYCSCCHGVPAAPSMRCLGARRCEVQSLEEDTGQALTNTTGSTKHPSVSTLQPRSYDELPGLAAPARYH